MNMKTAIIAAPGKIVIENKPVPKPAPHEVLIRLEGCGICASDLPVWQGRDWFDYPQEAGSPGHEGWGWVAEVGEEVESPRVGDKVAAVSYHAYAEYDVTDAKNVAVLPEQLHGRPFSGEPLGCAWNIFERSEIKAGDNVAIIGIGFLGSLLTQLAKNAGARVIAISRRESSLEMALKFGADEIISLDDVNLVAKVDSLTKGRFCDKVVEATGKEGPLNLAGELAAVRGKIIIAGYHQDGMRQVNVQLWNWKGLDVINAHERDPQKYISGIRNAMEAVVDGRMRPDLLYTHEFGLEDIQKAFQIHADAPPGFVKAILKY
ncbi:Threonine dehydrogenase [Desulfonatronum thiosulfatophilum]|uniref:Threonine dehydrogenase n=1 Tax=Desulfonatronum thiosulfatophilum TaxID=617002 RepID=A0A1G6BCE1_9BACT|nr:zinc-binding dehydrogenase [Desulfonatronum thiosulfatophilum]SDB18288.1 Threonine dehydrogenase [Desulfonatronum thiosulfatophilum]